jgi:UDP-N-acetylglucosamine 2-epimerase (non-hydrolysing)
MKKKKLAIIYGTRPEIIKLSPIIHLCRKKKIPFFCVHTGQHYSYDMDEVFFRELELPAPDYKLHIRSKAPYRQGDHTGRMLIDIENILLKEMPYSVVVQGDTNTAFAGALTAEKISTTESYTGFHIKVAHVEAGLRSYDRSMPEETNRFIADHLADFLFVPTRKEKAILLKEGVNGSFVHITGNTIADAVKQYIKVARRRSDVLERIGLRKGAYMLVTLHRQENVDSKKIFQSILLGLSKVFEKYNMPIVFSMHPRTKKMISQFGIKLPEGIWVIEPLGFIDFLWLEASAALVLSDSGGVQEEACILKVPCVTLRNNTERPETVSAGSNLIAGTTSEGILKASARMMKRKRAWKNPFGDGRSAERMLNIIMR